MKKILALCAAVLLVLSLSACNRNQPTPTEPTTASEPDTTKPTSTEPTSPPDTTEPDATEPPPAFEVEDLFVEDVISDDDGGSLMRIDLSVPQPLGLGSAQTYYQDWLSDARYYIGLDEQDLRQNGDGAPMGAYTYESGYTVYRNDDTLFTVLRQYVTYTGGAHEGTQFMAENFVSASGVMLTLEDLFSVPADVWQPVVRDAVLEQMTAQLGDSLKDFYDGFENQMMDQLDSRAFCVTSGGVIFFWQVYDLAPYTAGPQLFEVPFDTLDGLIDPQWLP